MKAHRFSLATVFAWPAVLAGLSLIGLIGALLRDGVWNALGAGLLATCLAAVVAARISAGRH